MRRAAEAEEARFIAIGVEPEHRHAGDPGGGDAVRDIGFQIELEMARAAFGEEAFIGRVVGCEAIRKARVHLVTGARDARADRGGDAVALCAERHHRLNGGIGDAA
ncbi:unnamed protein product [Rhizophagus irregularis]|uniref:Uncharacterized protein n=1 Tax=Rhizophagus irregularis TaxID=588596 RepID=A0A916E9J5_9GLOM|nr:unnamed protein product [Rhizophagus irregularis]